MNHQKRPAPSRAKDVLDNAREAIERTRTLIEQTRATIRDAEASLAEAEASAPTMAQIRVPAIYRPGNRDESAA